jgi:uncharacterized protein (TIGR03066 family)
MRTLRVVLVGAAGLVLAACTAATTKKADAPASVDRPKDVIVGRWEATDKNQFFQVFEFEPEGKLKLTVKDEKDPVPGTYQFTDDSTLEVEYQVPEATKKAYRESVKAAKKALADAAEKTKDAGKDLDVNIGGLITGALQESIKDLPDEFPTKDKFKAEVKATPRAELQVAGPAAASAKPQAARMDLELTLTSDKGYVMRFKKAAK